VEGEGHQWKYKFVTGAIYSSTRKGTSHFGEVLGLDKLEIKKRDNVGKRRTGGERREGETLDRYVQSSFERFYNLKKCQGGAPHREGGGTKGASKASRDVVSKTGETRTRLLHSDHLAVPQMKQRRYNGVRIIRQFFH